MGYRIDFIEAIKRTEKNEITVPYIVIEPQKIITRDKLLELESNIFDKIFSLPKEQVEGQCVRHSLNSMDSINALLNTNCIITFGYLELPEHKLFYRTEEEYAGLIKSNTFSEKHNIHCWLTLPSLEVIDITLLASLFKIGYSVKVKKGYQEAYISSPEMMDKQALKHIPMFVGEEFLQRIGGIIN